ncbi:right-handed parallel beta-helix repeat-containing protein [Spirosoma utsteinense]|uniref:Parallel beta-helix repeat protein n=1 Tax=Spirosoma utsteinense TaxID=2585773 RepID=A0ABR6W9N2_9BACT|nr:right-handed parallel beta-helix repeat-containing protein [Spirosoma utsteinense]MBC3787725.1 parallel beta-helix repeat protein [Spirosoma utsteinense]MBC3792671.1 parallel beta-helix repeat protein [Spirosoma utsteinense]
MAQTTYFVAATGSDASSGRSIVTPFQSLTKVNSLLLVPGDSILLRRGDTFRGGLVIRQSGAADKPIVFDAYGSGPKPVITGSAPITNWTNIGGNVWQAPCRECGSRLTGLYRNGTALPLGRYPNPEAPSRGYLTVQSHTGNTQITSEQPLSTDWTGGEVVIRPTYWIIDHATISRQQGNTLSLANMSTYILTDGWGYFIQNHPATLDQSGEWYYDPVRKLIRLYDAQTNPNSQRITATVIDRGVDASDVAYVTVRNLQVRESRTENLFARNVSNLTLSQNSFTESGEDGVVFAGSGHDVLIENSQITNANNNGIASSAYTNFTLRGSIIRHIGLLPGRGKSGDGQFTGLQSVATNTLIENNIVDSIGYVGINFWNNTTIRHNTVSNFCMTKSDGGGLYVWNGQKRPMNNIKIVSNIVRNGIGTPGGTSDETLSGAHGIFLDDCAEGIELIDNTIANCQGVGIYMNAVSTISLIRNTAFNNSVAQLILYNDGNQCVTQGNKIWQNIFMSPLRNQGVVGYMSAANDLASYGSMGQNYFARPFDDAFTIRTVYNKTIGNDLALPQWQDRFGHDRTSKTSPITYKDYQVRNLTAQNRISSPFDRSAEEWGTWSSYGNGEAVWDNTNRLDSGSLRVDFSTTTNNQDSHVLVYKNIQAVTRAKTYLLRFDVIATANKKIDVFLRQREAPYQDLTQRYSLLAEPTRQSYELAFTASADEADALLTFQTPEDGQSMWLDNIRLQEATITAVDPADYVKLVFNPTTRDSLISLPDTYRDVKNHYHGRQVRVAPFSSVVLLKDPMPPVDVRLSLTRSKQTTKLGDVVSVSLTLQNESGSKGLVKNQVTWACRLPANLTLVNQTGFVYQDSLLTGLVKHLTTDTTFVFQARVTTPGKYQIMAQVTASTYADPDSTPDSGMDDGEDDRAMLVLVVNEQGELVTGLEPISQPKTLTGGLIFPNPATAEFTFVTGRSVQTIEVFDLLGRLQYRLEPPRRGQQVSFGEQLPAGQYVLRVLYDNGEMDAMKLVKAGR